MPPLPYFRPDTLGDKTWRATLPAFGLREITDNLLYGDRKISDSIGVHLDEAAILKRVNAGDLQAPEASDLTQSPSCQADAERIVAWLYHHADTFQDGPPLRFSQDRLLQGNATLYLADGPANHLAHLRLAAAIMKRSDVDIEVVFGARRTMLWLINDIPPIQYDPVPRSELFGKAFFPLSETHYEGVFARPSLSDMSSPMCDLLDYRSEQIVGQYSLVGWSVGFNAPLTRPPSEIGASIPGGPDTPLVFQMREDDGCTEAHLSGFCDESELFLGNTTSGLREYLCHLLG